MENKKVSVLGCGWYGLALAKKLISLGYDVKGSTTSEAKLDTLNMTMINEKGLAVNLPVVDRNSAYANED